MSSDKVVFLKFEQLLKMSQKYVDTGGRENMDDLTHNLKDNLSFNESENADNRQQRSEGHSKNKNSSQKARDRKPEMEHYSVRQVASDKGDGSNVRTQNDGQPRKGSTTPRTKARRQEQQLYQPKRVDRPTGFEQNLNEQSGSTPKSPQMDSGKSKRPTRAVYSSKFQQSQSPQEQKPLSPLPQDCKDEADTEICKPSPRTRKRPTRQIYIPKPRQQALEQQADEGKPTDRQEPQAQQTDLSPKQHHDLREKIKESRKSRDSPSALDDHPGRNSPQVSQRNDKRSNTKGNRGNKQSRRNKPPQMGASGVEETDLGNLSDGSHKSLEWDYQVEMAELADQMVGPQFDDEEWEDEEITENAQKVSANGQKNKRPNRNRRNRRGQPDDGQNHSERHPQQQKQTQQDRNRRERHQSTDSFPDDTEKRPGRDRPSSGRNRQRRDNYNENNKSSSKERYDRRRNRNDSWDSREDNDAASDNRRDNNRREYRRNDSGNDRDYYEDQRRDNRGGKGRGRKMDRREERYSDRPGDDRRRLHSEGSHSSDVQDSPKSDKNLGLKVTFGETERKVKLQNDEEGRRRQRQYSDGGRKESSSSRSESAGPGSPHGGGILYLPVKNEPEVGNSHRQDARHIHPAAMPTRAQTSSRGRGSHRTLYDPKNPTKHTKANMSPQEFHDGHSNQGAYGCPEYQRSGSHDYHHGGQAAFYEPAEYSASPGSKGDNYYGYGYPQASGYYESGSYQDDTYSRDPYYHSGYEQDISSSRERSPDHTKAQSILRDLTPLDSQLNNILSRGIHGEEGMRKVTSLRQELQSKYEQVILLDIDLANKHNIEQMLWKSAFYQIIEFLRRNTLDELMGEVYKQQLVALLDEGTSFYEGLLRNLQTKASFNIEDYLDASQPTPETDNRKVKLALLSAQRTMICLGDIARYREQANQTSSYGKARSWYMKAQQLAPKNGRPYNQLAILALYTKRKLDAVYYYMRSLAASNPFLTARESVMQLFDEARKKAAATEKKKFEEKHKREKMLKEEMKNEDGNRLEIWITPDGKASEGRVVDAQENELDFISTVELNKRFVLNFLNVHGKLFTKIGMESFEDVSCQMLQEFSALIQHTPPPIGNNRLLQLMCINMFAIDNCAPKDMEAMEENCRSLTQEQAVQIGLEMFGLLAARCVLLFKEHLKSKDLTVMNEDLHQLLPSVKVWSDWMMCHVALWNPPPLQRDPNSGMVVPIWKNLGDLCNVLKKVDTSYVKLYSQKKEGCDQVILAEDVMMAGFVPLLSLPRLPTYVHQLSDKEIARDCLRVDRLMTFGDYLCGIEPPMLSYNVASNQYVSVAPDSVQSEEEEEPNAHNTSNDDLDVIIESEEEQSELNTSGGDENFQELRRRHEELKKKMEEKQRHDDNIEALLQRHTEKATRPIQLEIRPSFLVTDTNGFIDHLEILKKLADSKMFTIVIPIVVLNELDGLAKGSKVGQYDSQEHANMVRINAEAAVRAVEAEFATRNSHWKAMTSKGSMMDTIAFRSEETVEVGTNDDLILQCCLYFCNDKARDFMPKDRDAPITLQRDVVLLTDDRNLRLKAHLRNVPVKDIPAFQRWAKVS